MEPRPSTDPEPTIRSMAQRPDQDGGTPRRRYPLLDPLRGLAAVAIVLVHTATFGGALDEPLYGRYFAHLDIGVPFFFVLSAFLLYRPFVAARVTGTEHTRFREYGRRRFARIAPAYWAVLTITAIVPGMVGAFTGNWWVYYGLLQSFPVYEQSESCVVDPFHCGVPVAWTLTIEVLFYLALPLYVLALTWLTERWRSRWLPVEIGAVIVLTAISVAIQGSIPTSDLHAWLFYSPLGRGWWFGLGLALAAVSVHSSHRDAEPAFIGYLRRNPGPPTAIGLLAYAVAVNTFLEPGPSLNFATNGIGAYVTQYILFGLIAALIILPAIFGDDGGGLIRRGLRHRTLVWLGLVSYGVFLWHYPVMMFLLDAGVEGFVALTTLTFIITLGCAAASYYALEAPLMRLARRPPARSEAAAGSRS